MIQYIYSGLSSAIKSCTLNRADRAPFVKISGRNTLLCILFLPVFILASLVHWILWIADEIFFPDYKNVQIKRPVFITGIPRSGTTHLLRTLAKNRHKTTYCTARDCIFGPTLSGKAIWRCLKKMNSATGNLFSKATHVLLAPFQKSMSSIHEFSWDAAEEDFIWLWPINACFLGFLISPNSSEYWELADLDHKASPSRRKIIQNYYKACIQKKLYSHEPETIYLCKNPSFSLWIDSLKEIFPDSRWIFCSRDLPEAVASQLSSLEPALKQVGIAPDDDVLADRFYRLLKRYEQKGQTLTEDDQTVCVSHDALKHDLEKTVLHIATCLDLELTEDFISALPALDETSSAYNSGHDYTVSKQAKTVEKSGNQNQEKIDCNPTKLV